MFSKLGTNKLENYAAANNQARLTSDMYFPFFMCEVKCGREGLDYADRQNVHSSSVAVRAILRLEQEADKFRKEPQLHSLDEQILVSSVSHDQQDARLEGHFATIEGDQWTYYCYKIEKFDLTADHKFIALSQCGS